jgi:hypothetical protein
MRFGTRPNAHSLNDAFDLFIGVDQTGAVTGGGLAAKPLPMALLTKGTRPRLILHDRSGRPLRLASFNRTALESALSSAEIPGPDRRLRSSKTALLVDCVLGLPKEAWPSGSDPGIETLWKLFDQAARNIGERQGYGLKPAAGFFSSLLAEAGFKAGHDPYPVRECEELANANSVFRTHPFQKNIQCGTYRIWRDLGSSSSSDGHWLNIRYFSPASRLKHDAPWLFEAYPSLLWREVLGLKTRNLSLILETIESKLPELEIEKACRERISQDADAADAAVLALGGLILQRRKLLFEGAPSSSRRLAVEGWIIGLPNRPISEIS